jgi:glycerol-3-phosphate acyltransferase PlsY
VGATNVFRVVGVGAGIVTLLVDVLKGGVPVWFSLQLFSEGWVPLLVGLSAVVGHTWSPFVGFKGGKGVATSAGVFAALMPWPTLMAFVVFALSFLLSRHVSVGSLAGCVALTLGGFFIEGISPKSLLALGLSLLILIRHKTNIRRLFCGEEP